MSKPTKPKIAVCGDCGRRVHAVPGPDGWRLLTLVFDGRGAFALVDHVCLPRCARYPLQAGRN